MSKTEGIKQAGRIVSDMVSLTSTYRLKNSLRDVQDFPMTPKGAGTLSLEVGQAVITTDSSQLKPGVELTITAVMMGLNDHPRYMAGGVWHRDGDLIAK